MVVTRDLGVLIDSRLTFRDHMKSVVSRGHLTELEQSKYDVLLCKDADSLVKAFITCTLDHCWTIVTLFGHLRLLLMLMNNGISPTSF